jgi:hypothetical protein
MHAAECQVGHVGVADGDGARRPEPLDRQCIRRRDQLAEPGDAVGGGDIEIGFDGERHPGQWPERLAPCSPAVHLSGGLARATSEQLGDRVEVRVGRGDAVEVGLNNLGGRHLARPNAAGEAGRRHRP